MSRWSWEDSHTSQTCNRTPSLSLLVEVPTRFRRGFEQAQAGSDSLRCSWTQPKSDTLLFPPITGTKLMCALPWPPSQPITTRHLEHCEIWSSVLCDPVTCTHCHHWKGEVWSSATDSNPMHDSFWPTSHGHHCDPGLAPHSPPTWCDRAHPSSLQSFVMPRGVKIRLQRIMH